MLRLVEEQPGFQKPKGSFEPEHGRASLCRVHRYDTTVQDECCPALQLEIPRHNVHSRNVG